jgi:hypothetical protein
MLQGALAGCGIQAVAFLLTGNVLAPIVAPIVSHGQLTLMGNEMPPASSAHVESSDARRLPRTKDSAPEKELVAQR